jgi:DNA-binding NtrC family response regulator
MAKVLIIEKKGEIQALVSSRLSKHLSVDTAADIGAIPHQSGEPAYDMILWDLGNSNLEGSRGVEWLELIQRDSPQTRVVLISHDGGIPVTCRLKNKNYQFVRRPIDADQLCAFIKSALENRPVIPSDTSHPEVRVPFEFEGIFGTSLAMREIVQRIWRPLRRISLY